MRLLANLIIFSLLISMAGFSKATTGLVDPTRPANYVEPVETVETQDKSEQRNENEKQSKVETLPDFRLNAIKIGRSSRMAVINGEAVSPGQSVGDARLIEVNSDSVVMLVKGKEIIVSLLPDSIKIRSSK